MAQLSSYATTTATAKQVSRLAGANSGLFNVMDPPFSAVGTPGGDSTAALIAARDAALATTGTWGSKGILIPPGATCTVSTPIDFRGISTIQCDGFLAFDGPVNAPCFKFGMPSAQGTGRYNFFGLYCWDESYAAIRYPLAQFAGLRGSKVSIGSCPSFVEILGEAGAYESTAFTQFDMGATWRLELRSGTGGGSGTGWINSNRFNGGALTQLRVSVGPWIFVTSIVGTTVTTATAHGFSTGQMVEMYNGVPADGAFRLVTVTDATHFELASTFAGSGNAGTGWRCCGPSGYAHNNNTFYNPDIEDALGIIHMQGWYNRILDARMEVGGGTLAWGPGATGNMVEKSNYSEHGPPPETGDFFPLTVIDHSTGTAAGTNYHGWAQPPRPWNSTQGRQRVVVDATTARTIALADENALITMTSGSANVITVPANATVAFGIGTRIDFVMAGAGQTSFVAAGGVTINPAGTLKINGQNTKVSLRKTATNTWLLSDGALMA